MSQASDLVQDAELQTSFYEHHTVHVYTETGQTAQERAVLREEHWKRQRYIGGGAYGSVWLEQCVKGQRDLELRAVKEVTKSSQASKKADYGRELEAISKFSHRKYERCFVKSFGWYETENAIFIAMEYFEHGDLHHLLYSMPPLSEENAQQITFQVLEGLHFMHTNGYAHRDLKPGNILVRSKPPDPWWIKLGDFGISKRAADSVAASSTVKGTLRYMAPELLDFVKPGPGSESSKAQAADMWALGEITFQMLAKEPTFKSMNLLLMYVRSPESFPSETLRTREVGDTGIGFVKRLMRPKPADRLTAIKALRHAWVATNSAQVRENVASTLVEPLSYPMPTRPLQDSQPAPSGRWSTVSMTAPPSLRKPDPIKNSDIRNFFGGGFSTPATTVGPSKLSASTATMRPPKVAASESSKSALEGEALETTDVLLEKPTILSAAVDPPRPTASINREGSQKQFASATTNGPRERATSVISADSLETSIPAADSGTTGRTENPRRVPSPRSARYFTIKAGSETAIETSSAHGIWCCGSSPNTMLSNVFKSTKVPIYLIFSVKGSRQFCGVAQMKSAWDRKITTEHWETVGWQGGFEVEWLKFATIPFDDVKHLTPKEDDNSISITFGRFVLELCESTGVEMLRRFGIADLVLSNKSSSQQPASLAPPVVSLPTTILRQQSSDLNSIGSLGVSALGLDTGIDTDFNDAETRRHSSPVTMSFSSTGEKRSRDEEMYDAEHDRRKRP